MQMYLLDYFKAYPELKKNDCYRIRRNLYSVATCSFWLGGARGKK